MRSEFELIEALKKRIPRKLQGGLGIGDDADFLALQKAGKIFMTADAVADGVDFHVKKIRPEMAGRKALAVNLSDLAAMGASPLAFTVTLGIPKGFSQGWVEGFYKGMMRLAAEFNTVCLGGDMTRARQFFAAITLMGRADGPVAVRSGAKAGDWIGVTGSLGGSILSHHYNFQPRLAEGRFLAGLGVHSMMDISDGFLQDLGHILKASLKGALLDIDSTPVSKDAWKLAGRSNCLKALEHAMTDGEDFELLFTVSPAKKALVTRLWKKRFARTPLSWVGRVTARKGEVVWMSRGRQIRPLFKKKGYRHF